LYVDSVGIGLDRRERWLAGIDLDQNPGGSNQPEVFMLLGIAVGPIVALIAGILILFMPRLLNYIVALYLIIVGVIGLVGHFAPAMTTTL
jgi:hypothetical protein